MKKTAIILIIFLFILSAHSTVVPAAVNKNLTVEKIYAAEFSMTVNPASTKYLLRVMDQAEKDKAILIIQLNTPGGLVESTRKITSKMLNSKVPIVVWIGPSGSRAASAGAFITYASDIAAMASGCNVGAAHPVQLGKQTSAADTVMQEKILNDILAYARAIANNTKRDTNILSIMITQSKSFETSEALEKGFINLKAESIEKLIDKLDGFIYQKNNKKIKIVLKTKKYEFLNIKWYEEFLDILSNPNVVYLLLILGMYGLIYELMSPGVGLPGVVGGICIILAGYGLSILPISYAGLFLIILGIILGLLDLKIQSHGILTLGGIVSFILGSLMLMQTSSAVFQISKYLIFSIVILTFFGFLIILRLILRVHLRKPVLGVKGIINSKAVAKDNIPANEIGWIMLEGELWKAKNISDKIIEENTEVEIVEKKNNILYIKGDG